jgi:hypothetical protein
MSERLETYKSFLDNQERVCKEAFDPQAFLENGTIVSSAMSEGRCGYIVAFRHPDRITEPVSEFAIAVSRQIPSFNYDSSNLHTTIAIFYEQNGVRTVDKKRVDQVCKVVDSLKSEGVLARLDARISFGKPLGGDWRHNSDSVIAIGRPNKAFVELVYAMAARAAAPPLAASARFGWGAYMTTNRMTVRRKKLEKLVEFQEFMKRAPALGESVMSRLDVCYYTLSNRGFDLQVLENFFIS